MRRSVLVLVFPVLLAAQNRWIVSRSPAFEIDSEAPAKTTLHVLGQLEQFRFVLGSITGSELRWNPPLQVLLFRDAAGLDAAGAVPGIVDGRERPVLALAADAPLPRAALEQLTRRLLAANTGRLPEAYARGIETFLSTLRVEGAKVIWGDPPPAAARTRDWARVHLLATTPDYAGRMRVLFYNLERGVAPEAAWSNAYGRSAAEMEREVDQYWKAGKFAAAAGPSAALNPERDFYVKNLDPEEATLAQADLLNAHSPGLYRQMLQAHRHAAEANEGLGLLALRDGDLAATRDFLKQAVAAGSHNAAALVQYARLEKNPAPAREALDDALKLNPQLAEAHYLLGQKASDPERRSTELQAAARLAPQEARYWEALARWQVEQKNFAEAARSWTAAEQAATTDEGRERMHQARMAIETQRLDYEESERARAAGEKQRALDQLKAKALSDLHAAEAHGQRAAPEAARNAIPWWDDARSTTQAEGTLVRVECSARTTRVVVATGAGPELRLRVADRRQFGSPGLACGPAQNQRIAVEYVRKPDARAATDGDLSAITFH